MEWFLVREGGEIPFNCFKETCFVPRPRPKACNYTRLSKVADVESFPAIICEETAAPKLLLCYC